MRIRHIEIHNFRGIKSLSWPVTSDFNCIIGAGDACKTTILTALDYVLSPRSSLPIHDSDFYRQDVDRDIVIQVTFMDWDDSKPAIKKFLREQTFAQLQCGVDIRGALPEPTSDDKVAISISLRIDSSLEPQWSIVKGRDVGDDADRKHIYASARAVFGFTRIEPFSDYHFSWGRGSLLTRLSTRDPSELASLVSRLARQVRQGDISDHEEIKRCQEVANSIRKDAAAIGVPLTDLAPQMDLHRQPIGVSALSLHEEQIPIRNKGDGSKKLVATAMQMQVGEGANIAAIDEFEAGLEPHRIRGLIDRLKNGGQQVFLTTHSPVVIRELDATAGDLQLCTCDRDGSVRVTNLSSVPGIQPTVRSNAEALLGDTIVACEGRTEIGCLRAYDAYRFAQGDAPIWSLATAYFDCQGAGNILSVCKKLRSLGYRVAALCDNDAPETIDARTLAELDEIDVLVCQWDAPNSTEHQLFRDVPWEEIPALLGSIASAHDTMALDTMIDLIGRAHDGEGEPIGNDPAAWPQSRALVRVLGNVAHQHKWIKRIDLAERTFSHALPRIPTATTLQRRLATLWRWVEDEPANL